MDIELVEKYLYWVARYLPKKSKEKSIRDIKNTIEIQFLQAKKENPQKSDRELTEELLIHLGAPYEVAADYSGQSKTYLIGPRRYVRYMDILKLTMGALILAFSLTAAVRLLFAPSYLWLYSLWRTLREMLPVLLMVYGFITLIFSIIERKESMAVFTKEKLLNLAAKPKKGEKISKEISILAIMLNIFMAVLLLMIPQHIAIYLKGGEKVFIFQTFMLRSQWLVIVLWAGVGIAKNVLRLYEGRYTARVTLTTLVANACAILFAFRLFSDNEIINPVFLTMIKEGLENVKKSGMTDFLPYISMLIFALISLYYAADSIWGIIKEVKYRRK